ncbi:hypothetical protein QE418_003409 [Microbacterium testaceum]|nr:hypothetical protein [Microbacterium testaceum]
MCEETRVLTPGVVGIVELSELHVGLVEGLHGQIHASEHLGGQPMLGGPGRERSDEANASVARVTKGLLKTAKRSRSGHVVSLGPPASRETTRSSEREPGPCQERHPDPADDVQCWLDAGHDGEHVVDGGTYRWSTPASTTPDAYAECVECGSWPTHAPACPRRQGERGNG